jgi:hypothetical protein
MRFFLLILLFLFLQQCSKPKTVLICGNHVCVNKAEAELFFEENLSIEVRIIDKKNNNEIDLVQLNLENNNTKNKQINIKRKKKTKENIKVLNNAEIKKIKKKIYEKKRNKKVALVNNKGAKFEKKTNKSSNKIKKKNVNKITNEVVDVCTIIKKCSIDSISKYLLKQGKKSKFPDITTRE